jgi:hypothetical protein
VSPEEAIRAFQGLGARLLVPMHRGTPDRLLREAQRRRLEDHLAVLRPGQTIRW